MLTCARDAAEFPAPGAEVRPQTQKEANPAASVPRNAWLTVPAPAAGDGRRRPLADRQRGRSRSRALTALRLGPRCPAPLVGAAISRPGPRTLPRTSLHSPRGDLQEWVSEEAEPAPAVGAGPRVGWQSDPHSHQSGGGPEERGGTMRLEAAGGFHDVVREVGTPSSRQVGRTEGGESCLWAREGALGSQARSINVCRVAFPDQRRKEKVKAAR